MIRIRLLTALAFVGLLSNSCIDNIEEREKYQRPEWLAGKVYTQVKETPELSTFAHCLELSGYDTIIDVSGSYTVFAPNDEAFTLYLQIKPGYNSVEDIPADELSRLVKYHIVQNPWSKQQLMSLDVHGWIDSIDTNNDKPRGFKRETLLLENDARFGIDEIEKWDNFIIVDTTETSWVRRVAKDSRKYVPIFFRDYLNIYNLTSTDYEFYFDRPLEGSNDIYYAGAKVIGQEIFAENGFVYNIDRVVEPLPNAYQIIGEAEGEYSYKRFQKLVNLFPDFEYNEQKTFDQPGADQGLEVDSLFDLNFPDLTFDITNERTSAPSGEFGLPGNVSIRYHHGMIAPTNDAMDEFEAEYFEGPGRWGSVDGAPANLKRIIANSHLCINPIYPTDLEQGFYNGELDLVTLNEEDIVQKEFGSNSTFIGSEKVVVPRAFKSVTGPIYLQRGYSIAMNAIETTGLLSALKRQNENYMLLVESDANCRLDSSLLYEAVDEEYSAYIITPGTQQKVVINTNELRTLLLNHVVIGQPQGVARKEFLRNLAGNYIIFNNETGEVKGTNNTTLGYQGFEVVQVVPNQISENADNGTTWNISDWLSFAAASIYIKISSGYPVFHDLLVQAGLANVREYRYVFLSESENYTIFIPSEDALNELDTDNMTNEELRSMLMMHFVQGDIIFTDGRKSTGYYETTRVDETSTPFSTVYTKMFIETGTDLINIPDSGGTTSYVSIPESSTANILTGRSLGEGNEAFPRIVNSGVIHTIDKVLTKESVDTNQ